MLLCTPTMGYPCCRASINYRHRVRGNSKSDAQLFEGDLEETMIVLRTRLSLNSY